VASSDVEHTQLTAFGRNFTLKGYVLADMATSEKVCDKKDLLLSKYIPHSAMILISDTAYQANQPSSQNNTLPKKPAVLT
jgi:hypothetical protein